MYLPMNYIAKTYMYLLNDIDIRAADIWSIVISRIYDLRLNESTDDKPMHLIYHTFKTDSSYFEFVKSIKHRCCDELIEFIIIRGIYDIFKDQSAEDTKLMFFKQIADVYIRIDGDRELCVSIHNKKNFCKNLETGDMIKLEKLYSEIYHEVLFLIRGNLFTDR
jgi:hypothetical protein